MSKNSSGNTAKELIYETTRFVLLALVLLLSMSATTIAAQADEGYSGVNLERAVKASNALSELKSSYPGVREYSNGPLVTRLYGTAFGHGYSPRAVAEQFRTQWAEAFGVSPQDLVPGNLTQNRIVSQPVMYNPITDSYKFTMLYYSQYHDGVPVYGSELRLLVRNEPEFPLVLAISTLRDLGDFAFGVRSTDAHSFTAEQAARTDEPELTAFSKQETVIWAGSENELTKPLIAVTFIGQSDFPEKFRYVVDPSTGDILHKKDLIIFEDVVGNVSGWGTPGPKEMNCTPSALTPLPYALVSIDGGNSAYADENGDFTIANDGTSPVSLLSPVAGMYFEVHNYFGSDDVDTLLVTPPGPADFVHTDDDEWTRAQFNGYLNANEVRDFALKYNPVYPTVHNQTGFDVNVNRSGGYCPGNAWYDGSSLNFCSSSLSYGNTSFASVAQHEYGHHLIAMGGSGQGQYGEGMADCVAMLIADDAGLGYGFYKNQCSTPLRNADNDMQYPCEGEIHYCGQLLSGCVWDTRNELVITEPGRYIDTLANLTINSILLHTGTSITPQITIDFLTLDDDDASISNGTPHTEEICTGFGAHGMSCPEFAPISFTFPDGRPETLLPDVATNVRVVMVAITAEPVAGSAELYYSVNGAPFLSGVMTEVRPNDYLATLPGVGCDSNIEWYITAEAVDMGQYISPPTAPSVAYYTIVATLFAPIFTDNFETSMGWTVSGDATGGLWERGVPAGNGGRGDPPTDADGSGQCYLTENRYNCCDVDFGTMSLTSPTIDLSEGDARISYYRWYSNDMGNDPNNDIFEVYISNDDGGSWVLVEQLGPIDQASGGWHYHHFSVSDFVTPTALIKVRFDPSDLNEPSIVEAGIDAFKIVTYECDPFADSDEDGVLNTIDNCPYDANADQLDTDDDGYGDVCDNCQYDTDNDADLDGHCGDVDNCPAITNPHQFDDDSDTLGDECDNCPYVANIDQADYDEDGIGDVCDYSCCKGGTTGNIDCDPLESVDGADLSVMIDRLFITPSAEFCCPGEANLDYTSGVDGGDLSVLINHLFINLDDLRSCH